MPSITSDVPILVAVAIATFVVPIALVIAVVIGVRRRNRKAPFGSGLARGTAFLAGASLGTLLLFGLDMAPSAWGPLVLALIALIYGRWRVRRRVEAGWLLVGSGLPWAIVLAALMLAPSGIEPSAPVAVPTVASALALAVGLVLVRRGDPPPPMPDARSRAGQPGSRALGSIAEAIRGPGLLGPIGTQELAMLIAFAATSFLVPLLIPATVPALIRTGVAEVLAAILATEAYVRGLPTRSRRAFEAFGWLGEWELARVRELTGGGVNPTRSGTEKWLARHPERPELLPIRIEFLAFADRIDEARDALTRLPTDTPWERFEVAALRDLVDWRAGGEGDLAGMEETAADIRPQDSDDRLRAEVTIAIAKVRRRMADGRAEPGDAAQPLVDVRARLGKRADGQIGRALRPRLLPGVIVVGLLVTLANFVFGGPS